MVPICADRNSDLRPEVGWVRTSRWRTGFIADALVGQELGEAELAAREDQRVLADQVLDLGLGRRHRARRRRRACRRTRCCRPRSPRCGRSGSSSLAGTTRNEASECHSRLPSEAMRRRSSRASFWPVLVEVGDVGEGGIEAQLRAAHGRVGALLRAGRSCAVKASCCSSVMSWPGSTSTAYLSMPASIASTSSGVSGWRTSMPVMRPPIWRREGLDLDRHASYPPHQLGGPQGRRHAPRQHSALMTAPSAARTAPTQRG